MPNRSGSSHEQELEEFAHARAAQLYRSAWLLCGSPLADLPVRAAEVPRLFTTLHPGQVTPAEKRSGRIIDDGRAGQIAHFRWNGFMTTVGFVPYAGTPRQRCREIQQDAVPPVTCLERPDGSLLIRGGSSVAHDGGGVSVFNHASPITKDGYEIFAIAYNWRPRPSLSWPPSRRSPPPT